MNESNSRFEPGYMHLLLLCLYVFIKYRTKLKDKVYVWSKINSEDLESLKQIRFLQYLLNELLHYFGFNGPTRCR